MPISAMPERLQDPAAWAGTDMDVWYQRWILKYIHGWFAYGPRAKEWWGKWREFPKTLFAVRSKQGVFRIETEGWERDSGWDCVWDINWLFNTEEYAWKDVGTLGGDSYTVWTPGYLSRIQYYTRWHVQIQWPFMIAFHVYFRAKDVPEYGKPRPNLDNKLFYFYIGAHRDSDKVFWFPSAFVGLCWK